MLLLLWLLLHNDSPQFIFSQFLFFRLRRYYYWICSWANAYAVHMESAPSVLKSPMVVPRFTTTMANLNKTQRHLFCISWLRLFFSLSLSISLFCAICSFIRTIPYGYVYSTGLILCDAIVWCRTSVWREYFKKNSVHSFYFDSFMAFLVVLCWNISIKGRMNSIQLKFHEIWACVFFFVFFYCLWIEFVHMESSLKMSFSSCFYNGWFDRTVFLLTR